MTCEAVILAAGLGTRMKSALPKVLHPLRERPILEWVLLACEEALGRPPYVVVGPEAEAVRRRFEGRVRFVEQAERLGTAHAVLQARPALPADCDRVLVVNGDLPLLRGATLRRLVETHEPGSPVTLLAAVSERARGFGRLLRDEGGRVVGILEEAHATPEQRAALQELNVGAYVFDPGWLWPHLEALQPSPKGEYYLTDLVAMAAEAGHSVGTVAVEDLDEIVGVNTREHLAEAEAALRRRINREWMLAGVTIVDPATTYIGPEVRLGQDTVLLPNTHLGGETVVGRDCVLGPNTVVRDSTVGDRCRVEASVVEGATLEEEVEVGPFAHLRPGAYLCRGVHMGNFGEVKNSRLGPGVRMGHFSYIGDATVGADVNIGAGTITCNYDGVRKHRTEIEEGAFIGSDTMLVAPVRVGRGARTGAGAVVTRDVPDHSVAVGVPARVIRRLPENES